MEHEVLVLKLSSGEEVIAQVQDEESGTLTLINPKVYLPQQGGFVSLMPLSKNKTMVMTQRPMMIATPSPEAEIAYLEVLAKSAEAEKSAQSKIVTPAKKIILA